MGEHPHSLESPGPRWRVADGLVLLLAMTYPTALTWIYFVALARSPGEAREANPLFQAAYTTGKAAQFALPLLWVWAFNRWGRSRMNPGIEPLSDGGRPSLPFSFRPDGRGLLTGLGFGVVVALGAFALYYAWLRPVFIAQGLPGKVLDKVAEFGLASPGGYLILAAFIAVVHSFLEEYYWRWLVFGRLTPHTGPALALTLSGLAFMGHHVVVLNVYLPGWFLVATLPLSLAIAVGGAVWAWLYLRTGSLLGPWLSHLVIDAAILVIGYDLLRSAP